MSSGRRCAGYRGNNCTAWLASDNAGTICSPCSYQRGNDISRTPPRRPAYSMAVPNDERSVTAMRKAEDASELRACGYTWSQVAQMLDYASPGAASSSVRKLARGEYKAQEAS